MAEGKFVSYLRVSTKGQRQRGLGLEGQRAAVEAFLSGGNWKLVAEYIEVESRKETERPQLARALAACRLQGATLVVAKLDRLSSQASHIFRLLDESRVSLQFVDMPEATPEMIGFLAIMAESEGRRISARTKAALAAAKARGTKLGNPANLSEEHRRAGSKAAAQVRSEKAANRARDLAPVVADIRAAGSTSLRQIAAELDRRGIPASRGGGLDGGAGAEATYEAPLLTDARPGNPFVRLSGRASTRRIS